jgi:hypothetical protein
MRCVCSSPTRDCRPLDEGRCGMTGVTRWGFSHPSPSGERMLIVAMCYRTLWMLIVARVR